MSHYRIPLMTRNDREQRRERIIKMAKAGRSDDQIAAYFELTRGYVKDIRRAAGITRSAGRPKTGDGAE